MAGHVQALAGEEAIKSELRKKGEEFLDLLAQYDMPIVFFEKHGLDRRLLKYYLTRDTGGEKKIEFLEKMLEVLRTYFPGLTELQETLEEVICLAKMLDGKSEATLPGQEKP